MFVLQGSLLTLGEAAVDPHFATAQRRALDATSWVEFVPGWLTGADDVFADLVERLPWRTRSVTMFERRVAEPRLSWWWSVPARAGPEPLPVLAAARAALSARYDRAFDSIGCNLYRDGRDSVAWHGDRHARQVEDPVVAVLTVGGGRPFLLRPRGGGRSVRLLPRSGDLLVMGGASQHDWDHCVPKVAHAAPRMSITFRHDADVTALRREGTR